jgi:hypothetical protein
MKSVYYYENIPLRDYCFNNQINYYTIISRIRKLKKDGYNNDIVGIAIKEFKDSRVELTYNGISLKKYCEENGYNYDYIYRRVKDLKREEQDKKIEEFIKNEPRGKKNKIKINGMYLNEYCSKYNYTYSTVKFYLRKVRNNNTLLGEEQCIRKALLMYQINELNKDKYYYKKENIKDYSRRYKLKYKELLKILNSISIKNFSDISCDELDLALKLYRDRELEYIFNNLSKINKTTLKKLHINIDVLDTNKILEEYYFNNNSNLSKLFGYYKLNIKDTRLLIIDEINKSTLDIISSLINKYNITCKEFIDELGYYYNYLMYELCSTNNYNQDNLIRDYFNRYLEYYLDKYIRDYLDYNKKKLVIIVIVI